MALKEQTRFKNWHFFTIMLVLIMLLAYLGIRKHINKEYQVIHHFFNSFGEIWVYEDEGKRCLSFEKPNVGVHEQTCIYTKVN
ncbi:MAG: hypothetical protein AB8V23_01285 [Candidatus Midichloria sp.]|uniref:Uncharacterized protein n=1 Tax=Hyalomma marginatum TaxID=34627 RepID=A0A8S4BY14_9ACAR|nr:hypothetical protein MHYMCMPSP_00509 [Hyalomma marginatum]CAG7598601.1 hypothetical protein MHYMCMPASI_01028 [Hyalomma marginatum]